MIEIIPAIMPEDTTDLEEKLARVVPYARTVQLDLMDGRLVRPKTWPYNHRDAEIVQSILREEEGLPFWEHLDFELDLMVEDAEEDMALYLALGARRLVFHPRDADKLAGAIYAMDPFTRDAMEIGLAVPSDGRGAEEISEIVSLPGMNGRPLIDFVQCMGIERIGYQGEPFDPRAVETVSYLRKSHPDLTISVDGGVSSGTIRDLAQAGATRFVVGSAIFGSPDIEETINELVQLAQEKEE